MQTTIRQSTIHQAPIHQAKIHPAQAEVRRPARAARVSGSLICLLRDVTGLAGLSLWAWASLNFLGGL